MEKKPELINTERETRIFFWFMTVILVVMSVMAVLNSAQLRQPLRLLVFAPLMILHILLHWLLRIKAALPGWLAGYMLAQGLLAGILVYLSLYLGLAFAISMALVGEAVGVYGVTRRGILVSIFYLLLSLGLYAWLFGVKNAGWWILASFPIIFFVMMYVEMYTRQSNANERAQQLLQELEAANQRLTDYAAQVEDLTIAAERQRMARELHDTLSQGLAGLILQLEAADAHLAGGTTDKARRIVQQTMDNARLTLADARRVIDDLREEQVLNGVEALRQEAERFSRLSGVPCDVDIHLPFPLDDELTSSLLRIVTEAFANIQRHAGATHTGLRVQAQDDCLLVEIQDNGKGFDPQSIPDGHYGLIGMRERARLMGGVMQVESQPGMGTIIRVRIPRP